MNNIFGWSIPWLFILTSYSSYNKHMVLRTSNLLSECSWIQLLARGTCDAFVFRNKKPSSIWQRHLSSTRRPFTKKIAALHTFLYKVLYVTICLLCYYSVSKSMRFHKPIKLYFKNHCSSNFSQLKTPTQTLSCVINHLTGWTYDFCVCLLCFAWAHLWFFFKHKHFHC